jgi:hypothetical protein
MRCFARYLIMCIAALGSARVAADDVAAEDTAAVAAPASAPDIATVSDVAAASAVTAPVTPSEVAPASAASATAPDVAIAPAVPLVAGAAAPANVVSGEVSGSPVVATSGYSYADRLVVDKSERRLRLLKAGQVIAEYPIRLGLNPAGHKLHEGDFRTPEGHYYLSRRNPRSEYFLSIEVSYPNDADRRRARGNGKQPGGSIMIHGLPNVPRKPADYYVRNDWTDGCIAVSNSDMVDIWLRTTVGVPIDIEP